MTAKGAQNLVVLLLVPGLCLSCYGSSGLTGEGWETPTRDSAEDVSSVELDWEEEPGDVSQQDISEQDSPERDSAEQDFPGDSTTDAHDFIEDDVDDAVEMGGMATCDEVTSESHYCATILGLSMPLTGFLGLETGNLCLLDGAAIDTSDIDAIGWIDPFVLTCSHLLEGEYIQGIVRISTLDGSTEVAPHVCQAVTTYNGGIIEIMEEWPHQILFYPSFEDALVGDHDYLGISPVSTDIIAIQGERLYAPGEGDNEISVFQLSSGESLETIRIEGYGDRIQAMSVTEDGLLVLFSGGWPVSRVAVFDVGTGDALWSVYPSTGRFMSFMVGLYCVQGL